MNSLISAIVPTYNRADLLPETLAALAGQTIPLHEVIVWDDGSSDTTEDAVTAFAATSPSPVRYFKAANAGKSRALNAAMQEATGGLIWICDDDDIARPDAAERMKQAIEQSGVPIAAGRHVRFSVDPETGEHIEQGTGYWPDLSTGSILRHVLEDVFFFQNAMLVRRECYDKVGPFREDLTRSIDYDMIARLVARFPVVMVDGVLFDQRKHDGARGPAAARHSAAQSEDVWLKNDQAVFEALYSAIPLSLYESMYQGGEARVVERAALLQRGGIYARRSDWDTALKDFEAAVSACPDLPLSEVETGICRRAMSGKHGCSRALVDPVASSLLALPKGWLAGAGVVAALGRGVVWRFREAGAARDLSMLAKLASFSLRAWWASRQARSGAAGAGVPNLVERREIPAEAYQW
ncbi:glycosyltransferase family 2 protein [Rhodobacteraceae bacterium NNCM2]|nr:glycosyltransferase family 2 protein [Coraliihabitans acroporae]